MRKRAEKFRFKAKEARSLAAYLNDPAAQALMLRIGAAYERLAALIMENDSSGASPSGSRRDVAPSMPSAPPDLPPSPPALRHRAQP